MTPLNIYHKEHEKTEIVLPDKFKNLHMLVRKKIELSKIGKKTILRITADDYYKLYINGQFVGQGPAQGYWFCYYWNEYDITDFLREGTNEIFADVYYQGLINRAYNSGDRRMGMAVEIYQGESCLAFTDQSWEYTISEGYSITHTIGYDTGFAENFDSRYKPSGWQACYVKETDYTFSPQPVTPLEVYKKSPVISEKLKSGGWFYDFGQEITGCLSITANGKAGEKVRILYGEELEDGDIKVRYDTRCNCLCEEFWTLDEGENNYEQYDYKAFRYAAVIPFENAEIVKVSAVVRHYPFDDNYCTLQTDSKVLSAVWDICKNGVKYGSQEVYVDCPMREKGQYAGDLTITGEAQVILTGDTSLFKKAIDNQMQSAFVCHGLLAVTPGSLMQEIADYSLQFPILALRHYRYTKDRDYLKKNLKVCEGIISHFQKFQRSDGLLQGVTDKWNLVDWPENLRDGYDFKLDNPMKENSGCHNVINAFYIGCVKQTEEIREILGVNGEIISRELTAAFENEFLNRDSGIYADRGQSSHSSLHANVVAAYYGIYSSENEIRMGDFIMEKGLCCGVYMAYFVLKALCRMGRYKDAYSLIISQGEHSWYNMVKEGATTCFEAWGKEQKWNTSLCHPWASAPISVLAEDIIPNLPEAGKIIYHSK